MSVIKYEDGDACGNRCGAHVCEREPGHPYDHSARRDDHSWHVWSDGESQLAHLAEGRLDPAATPNPIQSPGHYTQGKIEVWDFIDDQGLGFFAGNVIKYVCRYRHKGNPKQDLLKARAYLDKLIAGQG